MLEQAGSGQPTRRLLQVAGALVVMAGLLVLWGWHAHVIALIKLHPSLSAMRYNTALCFTMLGSIMLLLAYGRARPAILLALLVGLIGGASLLEYLIPADFGIDQWLMHDYINVTSDAPGRMSLATALNFVLLAAALLLMQGAGSVFAISRTALVTLLLGLVIAQAMVVLVLYALGMEAAYKLVFYAGVALHTAGLMLITGVVLFYHTLRTSGSDGRQWLSSTVLIAALSFSLVLWQVIKLQQESSLRQLLNNNAAAISDAIESALFDRAHALQRMAGRWRYGTPHDLWLADSTQYVQDYADVKSLDWVDAGGVTVWHAPADGPSVGASNMPEARTMPLSGMTDVFLLGGLHNPGQYDLLTPVQKHGRHDGYLRMRLDAAELLQSLLRGQLQLGYLVDVQDDGVSLYHADGLRQGIQAELNLELSGAAWRLRVSPSPALYEQELGNTPNLALLGGIVMALLLLVVSELFIRGRQQQQALLDQSQLLQASEKKYRTLLNELRDGVFVAQDYRFVLTNHALPEMLDYAEQELVGLPFERVVAPEYLAIWRERFTARIAAASGNEPQQRYELQLLKRDGVSKLWVELYANRTEYEGKPGVIGIIRNREVEKALQQALDYSRERIELVAAGATDGIWDWDLDTDSFYLSPRYESLLGYAPGELAQNIQSWRKAVHPEDTPEVLRQLEEHLNAHTPYSLDYRLQTKDGSYRWFHASGQATWDETGRAHRMAGSLTDITVRKQQELALRQSEQRFRSLLEGVPDYAIYMLDTEGRVLTWNPGAERNKGYKAEEVMGRNFSMFFLPEEAAAGLAQQELDQARREGRTELDGWRVRKDGSRFWANIVLTAINDDQGNFCGFVKIVRDLSERREQELKLKRALAEKENLLKEVYHRVKNNLQVIRSLLNLQSRSVKDAAAKAVLADTASRVTAMAIVHEKLYRSGNLSAIELQDYVADLLLQLHESWGGLKTVEVKQDIAQLQIDLDTAIPLGLLLNELVSNSFKHAFPRGRRGTITVTLRLLAGDGAELCVEDDGVGFPQGADLRSSSSMGLKLADSLAGQLGGKLDIAHAASGGARFSVSISRLGRADS